LHCTITLGHSPRLNFSQPLALAILYHATTHYALLHTLLFIPYSYPIISHHLQRYRSLYTLTLTHAFVTTEISKEQRAALEKSKRIANPGCYPTGFIGLTRPLVDAGILPPGTPVTVNAISGYSGGGKALMQLYESDQQHEPWGTYGLNLSHKHVPEMTKYSGLGKPPIFQPAVASFPQGMVVSVPLHYAWLKAGTTGKDLHDALEKHYEGSTFVKVMPYNLDGAVQANLLERGAFLSADVLANTNQLQLFVFANDKAEQALLVARLDNLGKGASGAAVQNLNIALGLDEKTGLV
jgi:N-acetyl-gamma-glutamyl-phosphate reductase